MAANNIEMRKMCERTRVLAARRSLECSHLDTDPFADPLDSTIDSSSTPSQSHWFHGRLDRKQSESRLSGHPMGSFLIRESDRKPGSFVLSFIGITGVHHFRVNAICGDYYIGGRVFHSLTDLVAFYSHYSDLLKGERLEFPIPPPEPVDDNKRRVVAVLPYNKMPDTDELSFQKGDVFVVDNDLGNDWLWCELLRTRESGLVFADLVETLDEHADSNESFPWFHARITKEEAVERLSRAGLDSFLIRPSDHSPGNYSLFFHVDNCVQRFRIERRYDNRYVMGGRVFDSLEAIINRYSHEMIVEGHCLRTPVPHSPFERKLTSKQAEELRTKADVYATLRESREAARQNAAIRMKGFLHKKSHKHKRWRSLYFVLNAKESMLYFYESPKRTKPKGLVDLSVSGLYPVHDSLHDRPHCFQLVERALPCISTAYYLCAEDADAAQEWISALKPICTNAPMGTLLEVRAIQICLLEASRLPVKSAPHPFIEISLNGCVRVARSQVKCPPDPVYEEDFTLEDLSGDVSSFSFTLLNKGKRPTELAECVIELSSLNAGEELERWFNLSGLCPPVRDDWGSLRLRLRYIHEIVMPLTEYTALKELLLSDDLDVIDALDEYCHRDRGPLANALLKIAIYERREPNLLRAVIEREVQRESDTATLFRANSLAASLMDGYMRASCSSFLMNALSVPISRVLESKHSCELNPARLNAPLEACQNAEHLLSTLDCFAESIFSNASHCPPTLRYLCGAMQRSVTSKWPQNALVIRTRVVSSFIFLRLICPAILNPRQFNLINDTPSDTAARSLILVAKSLQNLANLIEFGTKSIFISSDRFEPPPPNAKRESWMEIVNPFILKNKAKMIKFLDELSSVPECPSEPDVVAKGEPSRELALVHTICELHREEIVNMGSNRPTLKKLAAVVEMLSKHKSHYTDARQHQQQ